MSRSKATGIGALCLLWLLAGCSGLQRGAAGAAASISGTISYRERMALAPDDTIRVVLEDVSLTDAAAPVLAEQMIAGAGQQVPVPFVLSYDSGWIQHNHRYALRAEIRSASGTLLWTTDTLHPVITQGAPAEAVAVRLVRASAADAGMSAPEAGLTAVFDCSWTPAISVSSPATARVK
ncbi:MAG: hypothetical protein BMS9Abin32_137 [Gammaproteobacteria bacterium]|nr:MAG: hypothetical protein BMS9Abin32_137 [Gammaproteobacteria bacterium]